MLKVNGKSSKTAELISSEKITFILAKHVRKIANNEKRKEEYESAKFQDAINEIIKQDGNINNFYVIRNEDKDELLGWFYQTHQVRTLFQTYGEFIFVDSTFGMNKHPYSTIVFYITDNHSRARVIGLAGVAYQRGPVMKAIVQFFEKLNNVSVL